MRQTGLVRAPFDVLALAAVADEAQCLVGSALERVWEPEPHSVALGLYRDVERWFLLCAAPGRTRAHLLSRRPMGAKVVRPLSVALHKRLEGAVLTGIAVRGDDRTLDLYFDQEGSRWAFVAELHGRMPNLLLVDPGGNCVAADRWLGPGRSVRPVVPGKPYAPPPGSALLPNAPAKRGLPFRPSPFAAKLAAAGTDIESPWVSGEWCPVYSPDFGAYPLPLAPLGVEEARRDSISQALEQAYAHELQATGLEVARKRLAAQLERVRLAREVALREIEDAIEAGGRAWHYQALGELILAYQHEVVPGAAELTVTGFDGLETRIALDPELGPVENAQRLFAKAKKARARAAGLGEQRSRFEADVGAIADCMHRLAAAQSEEDVAKLAAEATERRWLHLLGTPKPKEERPFAGHAVRELLSPAGWRVLYGESATANDYVTGTVAKPRDLWFHVRGAPSAHVVLATNNQPGRVQMPDILFAARVAAKNSPLKHSGYTSVDYTEKRYVRKPKGSAPGLAVYTHEKTVHIEQ